MSNDDVDFREIETMFSVIEKCVGHSGKFPGIMAEANNQLQAINDTLRAQQVEQAKVNAEQAAADEAERIAAVKDDEELGAAHNPLKAGPRTTVEPQRRL